MARGRWLTGLFAATTAAALVNAAGPWGREAANVGQLILQTSATLAALGFAAATAARASGGDRAWRLLVALSMTCWLAAETLSWPSRDGPSAVLPVLVVGAYVAFLLLLFAALVIFARINGGIPKLHGRHRRQYAITTALDICVGALSFLILILMGLPAVVVTLPRSDSPPVAWAFACLEGIVVVVAVAIALVYLPSGRSYRNYLLLTAGTVVIVSADCLHAYLHAVGMSAGDPWVAIGFVVGPLLIAAAAAVGSPDGRRYDPGRSALAWIQLVLPYLGFFGVAMLFSFHMLTGQRWEPLVVFVSLGVILSVVARQVFVMRSLRRLAERLYEAQRRLAHQVGHDSLTGLPNRVLFGQRLDQARRGGKFVLIFVDLDDFKDVNDRFGHAAGDALLRAVGERLRECIDAADTVARVGGDEFAILLRDVGGDGRADAPEQTADRIRTELKRPFAVHGSSVQVRASMGIVLPDGTGPQLTSDDLLRQADVSMYAGKRLGKDTAVVYRPTTDGSVDFVAAMRAANDGLPPGFSLAYQPVVRLDDASVVAVEALARWVAPNGTHIPPETFVASAEAAGLGAALDQQVLELACREVAAAGIDIAVHINVGAARLGQVGFERCVAATLARHGLEPERLVIEITETVPIVDLADGALAIERLNRLGVSVALDDFGAGYNSLTYLHALPVAMIKLDRSLAIGAEPERDVSLYRSVVDLCDALGMEVVAEGIETPVQAATVRNAGCRLAQGHLFGHPVAIGEVTAFVQAVENLL